jgi:aminomethyltransferase
VSIVDTSTAVAAVSLQGPNSREILSALAPQPVAGLKYFGITAASVQGLNIWISRTGYTGDLGFEVWIPTRHAEAIYDLLLEAGQPHGLLPTGLDAMDVTRIEAGYIMNGVDYNSANHCLTEERKSSPFELDLGWAVHLDREPFTGQEALRKIVAAGPARQLVGLEVDWEELETVFDNYGLPPELPTSAWRDGRPVYDSAGSWIGQATSGVWSPILKKNLALAQIQSEFASNGTVVNLEITAEYRRHSIKATVVSRPFFDPARKRD